MSENTSDRHASATADADYAGTVTVGPTEQEYEFASRTHEVPNPVGHFVASLASCLSVSIRVQADIRDVDLQSVVVDAEASPDDGSVESISISVTLDIDAEDEVVDRIVTNGEQSCHVSELLRDELPVDLDWTRA